MTTESRNRKSRQNKLRCYTAKALLGFLMQVRHINSCS